MGVKICKDCVAEWELLPEPKGPVTYRPRPIVDRSGGRCATHWRKRKEFIKERTHEKRVVKVYGLADGDYDRLYRFQGRICPICRRANGATRKLSVDHDHKNGLVRGLLCRPCNDLLGHLRDDPGAGYRITKYLVDPPARQLGIEAIHEENRDG